MDDSIEIIRPKSKTMSLIERRTSNMPQLQQLQVVNKRHQMNKESSKSHTLLKDLNNDTQQQDSILKQELQPNEVLQDRDLNQQNQPSGQSGCFQLVKEIDERDHVFSPLKVANKVIKSEILRHRLNTGEYLSANDNYSQTRYNEEENIQKCIKPQHGIFQRFYKIGKKIGEGAHSVVKDCSRKAQPEQSPHVLPQTDKQLVVKIMKYRDTEILFQLFNLLIDKHSTNNISGVGKMLIG